jgi:multidrug resistance protein MdtO
MKNPGNVAFALKISLCATVCFILYHAVAWPGISTCVTTVIVTGLSTTAAMKQRLSFRLAGVLVGGLLLGLGTTIFLFPLMDTIASFTLLVGLIAFGIAWISGGMRFSPLSLNIAFSYYFVAIAGVRAQTELAPARDRLMGILLGLLVMWAVFDWLWPVRAVTRMQEILASVLRKGAGAVSLSPTEDSVTLQRRESELRRQISSDLTTLRSLDDTIEYDLGADRRYQSEVSDLIMQASLSVAALAWSQVLYIHDLTEGNTVQPWVRSGLREAISADLQNLSVAVENGLEDPDGLPVVRPELSLEAEEGVTEYERMMVSRAQTVRSLVQALVARRSPHWVERLEQDKAYR